MEKYAEFCEKMCKNFKVEWLYRIKLEINIKEGDNQDGKGDCGGGKSIKR